MDLDDFLIYAQLFCEKYDLIAEHQKASGGTYNVFDVFGLGDYEAYHSAFIADLMNPKSLHGAGDAFLRKFMELLVSNAKQNVKLNEGFYFPDVVAEQIKGFVTASVEIEKCIGVKSEDCQNGGRIDIFVELTLRDGSRFAVVIENKIWAGDQENQIVRYVNYAKRHYGDNFVVVYLSPDEHEPSEYSKGEAKGFLRISYRDFIKRWINDCIALSSQKPRIREILIQYGDLIDEVCNICEGDVVEKDYVAELLKGDNLKHVVQLYGYVGKAKRKIFNNLRDEIVELLKTTGISPDMPSDEEDDKCLWLGFIKGKYEYWYGADRYLQDVYVCIDRIDKEKKDFSDQGASGEFERLLNLFPDFKEELKGYEKVGIWRMTNEQINSHNIRHWNDELYMDINKNVRQYAEYFVKKAQEVFGILEQI